MKKINLLALSLPIMLSSALPEITFAQPAEQIQIDLLVFRHNTASREQIDDVMSVPPRPGEVIQPGVQLSADTTADTVEKMSKPKIVETGGLEEQARKIREAEDFDLLYEVSWQQPIYTSQNAPYISLSPKKHTGLLRAVAKVSFDRYFQLVINLLYDANADNPEPAVQDIPESSALFIGMKEVMTDNLLYYLDHPLLGALAKVTVKPVQTESDSGDF